MPLVELEENGYKGFNVETRYLTEDEMERVLRFNREINPEGARLLRLMRPPGFDPNMVSVYV